LNISSGRENGHIGANENPGLGLNPMFPLSYAEYVYARVRAHTGREIGKHKKTCCTHRFKKMLFHIFQICSSKY